MSDLEALLSEAMNDIELRCDRCSYSDTDDDGNSICNRPCGLDEPLACQLGVLNKLLLKVQQEHKE